MAKFYHVLTSVSCARAKPSGLLKVANMIRLTVIPGGPVRPSAPTGPGGPRSSGAVCSSDSSVDELLHIEEEDGEMLPIDRYCVVSQA